MDYVYVVYYDYGESCSSPVGIYSKKEDAEKFLRLNRHRTYSPFLKMQRFVLK